MNNPEIDVDELVAAFERPVHHLDVWGRLGPAEAAERLQQALDAIGASDDSKNEETARLVLGRGPADLSVSKIAQRHNIKPSAVSQRKSRIEQVLADLYADEVMNGHPLVRLWRERACRLVKVEDLPLWMQSCLISDDVEATWPTGGDVFWVLLHAVMRQPRLVTVSDGSRWLIDVTLDERGDTKDRLASVLQSLADRLAGSTSQVYGDADLRGELERLGVSPLSIDVVIESLGRMVQRSVAHSRRVLVLSNDDAKNLRRVVVRVMGDLGVDRADVPKLIAEQHGRHRKSVANELSRL
jgi:hypothetical protein